MIIKSNLLVLAAIILLFTTTNSTMAQTLGSITKDYINVTTSKFGVDLSAPKQIKFKKNKIKDGVRVGKWTNIYVLNKIKFRNNSDIPFWEESLSPFKGNYENVVSLFDGSELGCRKAFNFFKDNGHKVVFETCEYVNGKKTGEFKIQLCELNFNEAYYLDIISGNYSNDLFEGDIIYCLDTTSYSTGSIGRSANDIKPMLTIKYINGKINDQVTSSNSGKRYYHQFIEGGKYIKDHFEGISGHFKTSYSFKSEKIIESYFLNNSFPCYFKTNETNGFFIKYTEIPLCYNSYSFLTKDEISKGNLINLNTNGPSIEYIPFKINNNESIINGNYRLFKPNINLMDTNFLWASYHYSEGKRNGTAEIWDQEKNGKQILSPFIRLNFKHDKLNGVSEMFYPDHKLAVSAEFKNGFVDGEVISYNNPPNHYPFEPEYHIKAWVHSGGILSIHQIGDFKKNIDEHFKLIIENGGTFEEPKQYEQYTKIRYKLDSISSNGTWFKGSVPSEDFYYFCNSKPILKYFINEEKTNVPKDLFFFDSKGNVVYSLSKAKGDIIKRQIEIEAEKQKHLNTEVKCASCNNKLQIKNAKENWGGCNCVQNNGKNIEVYGTVKTYFCSIQCKINYEKDCCKRNGYSY